MCPQGSSGVHLGLKVRKLKKTVYHVLKGDIAPEEAFVKRDNITILPANIELNAGEEHLSKQLGNQFLLKETLKYIDNFDYAIIDCPPSNESFYNECTYIC